jgi:hypothetical protein
MYSILSDRDINFPPLPDLFPEGFHQLPISNDMFEVDLNPEYNIDLTNEDHAKYNNNTFYCHLFRRWFACFNKDGCSYYYDCSATLTGISYQAMKDFKDLNEYNINELIKAKDCCK